MTNLITAKGIVKFTEGKLAVIVSPDFTRYYNWFITRRYWIAFHTPAHKPHITLVNRNIHDEVDWNRAKRYHNRKVEFEYDPYLVEGGFTKGFIMFYLSVYSKELDNIKTDLRVKENKNYKGLHITIANNKAGNNLWWPKMIELKNQGK